MTVKAEKIIHSVFTLLTKGSARKKVYSQKATKEGREELSHLLRAISHSESVQARRLLNSMRGKIDNTDQYVSTVFENEVGEMIEEY